MFVLCKPSRYDKRITKGIIMSETHSFTNDLTIEDLECLIMWPIACNGWYRERQDLEELLVLCQKSGYGRVSQLVQQIEDIWRNKDKIEEYKKKRKKHLEFMTECKEIF